MFHNMKRRVMLDPKKQIYGTTLVFNLGTIAIQRSHQGVAADE